MLLIDINVIMQELWLIRKESIKEQEKELRCLEKNLQELIEQRAGFLENYHAGILDKEQFKEMRNTIARMIADRKLEYEKKKKEVEQQTKLINRSSKDYQGLLCCSSTDNLTIEMVKAFIEHIEIDGHRNIDIYWTFNNQFNCNDGGVATV